MEDLIYIEDTDKLEAGVAANYFVDKDVRNRVYINTLSAELAMKYLVALGLDAKDLKNIHSVKKVIETFDIADVMMKNIHIDVRAVFDEDIIFIPKSHFEINLIPDIYLVFQYMRHFSDVKILGFFEPKLINKNNSNKDYYFIEKEKLCPVCELKNYIENFDGNTNTGLSNDEIMTCENLMVSLCDHDINEDDKKYLLNCLIKSTDLREKFNEFENFETLSYKAIADTSVQKRYFNMEVKADETDLSSDMFSNIAIADDILSDVGTGIVAQTLASGTEGLALDVSPNLEFPEDTVSVEPLDNEPNSENSDEQLNSVYIEEEFADSEVENNTGLPEAEGESFEEVPELTNESVNADFLTENPVEIENNFENIEFTDFEAEQIQTMDNEQFEDSDTSLQSDINIVDTEPLDRDDFIQISQDEEISLPEQAKNSAMNVAEASSFGLNLLENLAQEDIAGTDEAQNDFVGEAFELQDLEIPEKEDAFQSDEADLTVEKLDLVETPEISTEHAEVQEIKSEPENLPEFTNMTDISCEPVFEDFPEFTDTIVIPTEPVPEDFAENTDMADIPTEPVFEDLPEFTQTCDFNQASEAVNEFNNVETLFNQNFDLKSEIQKKLDEIPSDEPYFEDVITELPQDMFPGNNDTIPSEEVVSDANVFSNEEVDASENNPDELQVLYDDEFNEELPEQTIEIPQTRPIPGISLFENTEKLFANKKLMITSALSLAFVVAVLCGINMTKHKNTSEIAEQKPAENVLDSNVPTEVPSDTMPEPKIEVPAPSGNKVEVNSAVKSSGASMDVSKIIWDVPDSLSYGSGMQNFLRTAGKSIKLSLSADLLLADEYAYTNQVKVALKLSKDGNILDSKVVSGSGSSQIDNIVLQSVKDTLSVLKPPSSEINTPDFNLNLIIYF